MAAVLGGQHEATELGVLGQWKPVESSLQLAMCVYMWGQVKCFPIFCIKKGRTGTCEWCSLQQRGKEGRHSETEARGQGPQIICMKKWDTDSLPQNVTSTRGVQNGEEGSKERSNQPGCLVFYNSPASSVLQQVEASGFSRGIGMSFWSSDMEALSGQPSSIKVRDLFLHPPPPSLTGERGWDNIPYSNARFCWHTHCVLLWKFGP